MKSLSQESLRSNMSPGNLLSADVDGNSCRFDSAFRLITDYPRLCGDATTAESLSNKYLSAKFCAVVN